MSEQLVLPLLVVLALALVWLVSAWATKRNSAAARQSEPPAVVNTASSSNAVPDGAPAAPPPATAEATSGPNLALQITLESSVHVREKTEAEERYAELNRQATQVKSRSYAEAVVLLQEAKQIMGDRYEDTRLAKFMQQAGQFDGALAEIQWLLDRSHAQTQAVCSQQPMSVLLRQRAIRRAQIHKAAALICSRENRPELQAEHERLYDACWEKANQLEPIVQADEMARSQALDAAIANGPRAMQAVMETRKAETARNQALEDSPDTDVFQPLRARVQERLKDVDFFAAVRHFDPLIHLNDGDIDGARQVMQRLAYLVYEDRNKHPEQTAQFTRLMCMFVEIDPLFKAGVAAVLPIIAKSPGIRQTQLYPSMNMDVELCRYVLYFAHETGRITRVKKGNTYQVYLPQAAPLMTTGIEKTAERSKHGPRENP